MPERPALRWTGVCLDCADADELARFYEALLGWTVEFTDGHGFLARGRLGPDLDPAGPRSASTWTEASTQS